MKNALSRIFLLFFITMTTNVYSKWDPQDFVNQSTLSHETLNDLANPKFLALKQKVIDSLAGSWCSSEKASLIMDLLVLQKPTKCVEIGVFTGSSFLPIATPLKYLGQGQTYAIDAWSNQEAIKNMSETDPNKSWWETVDMTSVYKTFKQMVKNWDLQPFCTIYKESSAAASNKIGDIDFLHMDGNYTTATALADAKAYLPKVKVGGYILFSNLFLSIYGDQPKMDSFFYLLDCCEIVCEIDANNTVLLKKISEVSDEIDNQ